MCNNEYLIFLDLAILQITLVFAKLYHDIEGGKGYLIDKVISIR